MFSDRISEAYCKIYDGIKEYRDYCEVQQFNTIRAMTRLNMILQALDNPDNPDNYSLGEPRAEHIACFDYDKAMAGISYTDPPHWSKKDFEDE